MGKTNGDPPALFVVLAVPLFLAEQDQLNLSRNTYYFVCYSVTPPIPEVAIYDFK